MTRWTEVARAADGEDYAGAYAERFRALAAEGADVHGEASAVTRLRPPPASVLDAGCGTGRVGVRLAELGYDVVGCDVDAAMVDVARADAPGLDWRVADLACLDLGRVFDVVLLAGNVVPLLAEGTLGETCRRLAAHVAPGRWSASVPKPQTSRPPGGCPVTPLDDLLAATAAAGLREHDRWGTWDGDPWVADEGYVVVVLARGADEPLRGDA